VPEAVIRRPPPRKRLLLQSQLLAGRSFLAVFFGEEANLPRHLGRAITRRKAGYDTTVLGIVEAALTRDPATDVPPRLLVFALLGMSNWVYTWYRSGGPWTPDAVANAFLALIERGYRPSPAWRRQDLVRRLDRIEHEVRALRSSALEGGRGAAAGSRARHRPRPRSRLRAVSRP
jgi:hypothetical protein